MSIKLKNPLDKFQSYSVHHILLACRTTEDARVFMDKNRNEDTLRAVNSATQLGESVPLSSGKDTAFLVIDTRRFSQFVVQSLKFDVFINGLQADASHGNFATNVNMVVIDNVGISFINFLQWLMNEKMQTNFDGMIFMHRVIFVGHNRDGSTETVQGVTIPMHLHNVELNLDHARGSYAIEFMPNMNFDTTKHNRWLNISTACQYFTGKGINKLGPLVDSFEKQLNDLSADYFRKAQEKFSEAGRPLPHGRLVKYLITLPKNWYNMDFIGAATADASETVFPKIRAKVKAATDKAMADRAAAQKTPDTKSALKKAPDQPGVPKDTHLSVEPGLKITEVLDIMFSQVADIADLGAGRRTTGPEGTITFYKYFVGITSDDQAMVVHVDVVPFIVPNVTPLKKGEGVDNHYNLVDGDRIPKNYMEFDYIFTGKNKDILTFDMKMQNLTWLLAGNLSLGPAAVLTDKSEPESSPGELFTSRQFDPILLPRNTADELKNFSKFTSLLNNNRPIGTSQDYRRNLSMYYAMSPITTAMTIRGNPYIMDKFNQSVMLEHATTIAPGAEGQISNDKIKYRQNFEDSIIKNNTVDGVQEIVEVEGTGEYRVANTLGQGNYASSPVFVKINIKGPNLDFRTAHKEKGEFATDVLLDAFFMVMKVTNNFEGHTFTQDLELYSHNIFGNGKMIKPTPRGV